jgi:hypothetical protein
VLTGEVISYITVLEDDLLAVIMERKLCTDIALAVTQDVLQARCWFHFIATKPSLLDISTWQRGGADEKLDLFMPQVRGSLGIREG